jgi:hypothetical protein
LSLSRTSLAYSAGATYRQKGHFASTKDLQNREDALWARLQKIKVLGKSFADFLGLRRDRLSPIELTFLELDTLNALPEELVKNRAPSSSRKSA